MKRVRHCLHEQSTTVSWMRDLQLRLSTLLSSRRVDGTTRTRQKL